MTEHKAIAETRTGRPVCNCEKGWRCKEVLKNYVYQWQKDIIEREKNLTLVEELDAFENAHGNAWSEYGNSKDQWESDYFYNKLKERLEKIDSESE